MRIAVVHSFYSAKQPSGENTVVEQQCDLLTAAGHDVLLVAQRTDELAQAPFYAARAGLQVSFGLGPDPTDALAHFGPDVVHVHNLFPNWGTHWLSRWPGPLVATVHNFRPICINGLLFREGKHCEECISGSRWNGLRQGCYRNSRAASVPLSIRNRAGAAADPLLRRADVIIALSREAKEIYERVGIPSKRLTVVPNGTVVPNATERRGDVARGWLYVGRLDTAKGILAMLDHWPENEVLDIVGDGPLRSEVQTRSGPHIRYLGPVPHDDLLHRFSQYEGLMFPSLAIENSPVTLSEAISSGLPFLTRSMSAGALVARDYGVGVVVEGDDWAAAMAQLRDHRDVLIANCHKAVQSTFGHEAWIRNLLLVYESVTRRG